MEEPPHPRRLGDDEQAYFLGLPAMGTPDDRAGDISGFVPEPVNAGYVNKRKHQGGRPNPQDRISSVQPNTSNGGPL